MFSVDHLTLQYGNRIILSDCTFKLPECGLIGVLGPSGCGKTTLLYALSGLLTPSSGQILYRNLPLDDHHLQDHIAFMKQNDDLIPSLNVRDNITIGCQIAQIAYSSRELTSLSRRLQIDGLLHRFPSELSIGQQKRVSLARALLKKAPVILCDEPTGALHEDMARTIMSLLEKASHQALVIVVSHDETLLRQSTDQIIELSQNRLIISFDAENHSESAMQIRHKKQSLLPIAVKELLYHRHHYYVLCLFQWLVLSGFLLLLGGTNGLKTAIDQAQKRTVLKNMITVERTDGKAFTMDDAHATRHFLFEYGDMKEKAAKNVTMARHVQRDAQDHAYRC